MSLLQHLNYNGSTVGSFPSIFNTSSHFNLSVLFYPINNNTYIIGLLKDTTEAYNPLLDITKFKHFWKSNLFFAPHILCSKVIPNYAPDYDAQYKV